MGCVSPTWPPARASPQSMGELVDDLETKGYVERRPDPADRRAKRIHLTERDERTLAPSTRQSRWRTTYYGFWDSNDTSFCEAPSRTSSRRKIAVIDRGNRRGSQLYQ